jgi:ATP-dependent protease HslVU (ClpYQ) peptidase subunit
MCGVKYPPDRSNPVLQHYSILGCLREQVEELGAACKEEVFKRQAEAANDWRTDKELKEACEVVLQTLACVC